MKANHRGLVWEQAAETWLIDKGLALIARNFHCRMGEIDLIMREGPQVVFVEVKYRKQHQFGGALASVTRQKQLKISRAAGIFLTRKPLFASRPCRFDVVAISGTTQDMQVNWVRNAFDSALHF